MAKKTKVYRQVLVAPTIQEWVLRESGELSGFGAIALFSAGVPLIFLTEDPTLRFVGLILTALSMLWLTLVIMDTPWYEVMALQERKAKVIIPLENTTMLPGQVYVSTPSGRIITGEELDEATVGRWKLQSKAAADSVLFKPLKDPQGIQMETSYIEGNMLKGTREGRKLGIIILAAALAGSALLQLVEMDFVTRCVVGFIALLTAAAALVTIYDTYYDVRLHIRKKSKTVTATRTEGTGPLVPKNAWVFPAGVEEANLFPTNSRYVLCDINGSTYALALPWKKGANGARYYLRKEGIEVTLRITSEDEAQITQHDGVAEVANLTRIG